MNLRNLWIGLWISIFLTTVHIVTSAAATWAILVSDLFDFHPTFTLSLLFAVNSLLNIAVFFSQLIAVNAAHCVAAVFILSGDDDPNSIIPGHILEMWNSRRTIFYLVWLCLCFVNVAIIILSLGGTIRSQETGTAVVVAAVAAAISLVPAGIAVGYFSYKISRLTDPETMRQAVSISDAESDTEAPRDEELHPHAERNIVQIPSGARAAPPRTGTVKQRKME